jgi:phosphonate transport system ATP-binding protein
MVHLEKLSVQYPGGVQALQPTTLSLDRGAFTVLLGPSGAGKSTLLRCLNGLVHPSEGRVVVDGLGALDNERRRRAHRRRTAMVFQSHQLIGRLSVLRNVLTGRLAYHGTWRTLLPLPRADRVLALHCLERVGLLELALRRADQLSGGQQQRVGVARALAQQPALLLADEPVASLDPETARRVLGLLRDIARADGIRLVVSLHQVDLAREYADRIIGLADGRVVFDDAPAVLHNRHLHVIYRRSATPTPDPRIAPPTDEPAYANNPE